jgi:autotransporter-associated beta strand protein
MSSKNPSAFTLAIVSALSLHSASGADYYWDTNGTTSGPGSATPSGAWDGTNTFWNTDSTGGAGTLFADPGTANTAVFSADSTATGNFVVTASGTRIAQGLNFQEGGNIQLTGGTISLTGATTSGDANGLIQTNAAMTGTATIDSNIQVKTDVAGVNGTLLKLVANDGAAATDLVVNGSISASPGATFQLRLGGAGNGRITSNLGTALNSAIQQGNTTWSGTWTIAGNQTWGASSGITLGSGGAFGATGKLVLGDSTADIQSIGSGGIIAGNATPTTPITIKSTLSTTGTTDVRAGTVEVAGSLSGVGLTLGNGTLTTSGTLRLSDGTTAGSATFSGDVAFGVASGNKIVGGAAGTSVLTLNKSTADDLTTAVVLGGAGTNENNLRLVKQNSNTLTISGANTFTGSTTVEGGTLLLSNQNAIQNSTLTLSGGAANFSSTVVGNAFTVGGLAGAGNLALQNNAGTPAAIALSIGGNNQNASYSGVLSGAGSLVKNGNGTQTLSNASNTFTGAVTVNSGTLSAASLGGFGSARSFTLGGGTLSYTGSATVSTNNLNLNVTANSVLEVSNSAATLRTGGTLSGSGQLTINGPGVVALGQNIANATYGNGFTGNIVVSNGATLSLRNQNSMGSTGGGVAAGTTTVQNGGTLLLDPFSQSSISYNSETIAFQGTSTLTNRLNGQTSLATTLTGAISTAGTLTVNTREDVVTSNAVSIELSGAITGNGGINFGTTGGRAGTYIVSNNSNGYLGATNVKSGTLVLNGNISTSSLTTVESGATLGGSGTVGDLTILAGGSLNPGNSPGQLTVDGDYNQAGTLNLELNGLTAGTQHDQVNVLGTVTLSGLLAATITGYTPAVNDLLFIILNDGTDAVSGTFSGLAQGANVLLGGQNWLISYQANSSGGTFTGGNDVALLAVPEPHFALLGGLGVLVLLRRRR